MCHPLKRGTCQNNVIMIWLTNRVTKLKQQKLTTVHLKFLIKTPNQKILLMKCVLHSVRSGNKQVNEQGNKAYTTENYFIFCRVLTFIRYILRLGFFFVISRFCSIHFTVTLSGLKNIVRYTEDFFGFVKSRFHCTSCP